MPSILIATELTVRYGERTVLDGATLAVDESDRIGLVGRNRYSKTTRNSNAAGNVPIRCRIDASVEIEYCQDGDILSGAPRQLSAQAQC